MNEIGAIIAEKRRAKGATQDELAAAVGVSGQAVSKWENGGSPDIELLPKIAGFLGTSVDALFGTDVLSVKHKPIEALAGELALELHRFDGNKMQMLHWICECLLLIPGLPQPADEGYALLARRLELKPGYFFLMPAAVDGASPFAEINDYLRLFSALGDEVTLRTLYFLDARTGGQFTPQLLEKQLGLSPEDAQRAIANLLWLELLERTALELDGETLPVYAFIRSGALYAMFALAAAFLKCGGLFVNQYGEIRFPL